MIISMSDIICVTNRKLCTENFLCRVEKIAECSPRAIILREKDMDETEYLTLAESVKAITDKYNIPLIINSFYSCALKLGIPNIHMPLHLFCDISSNSMFSVKGTSCHSVDDAVNAVKLGADYIIAGHIFATDCKKGLAPRGLDFLKNVCNSVDIPVYAIGGISQSNYSEVIKTGAKGVCIMSGLMTCDDPQKYLKEFSINET